MLLTNIYILHIYLLNRLVDSIDLTFVNNDGDWEKGGVVRKK